MQNKERKSGSGRKPGVKKRTPLKKLEDYSEGKGVENYNFKYSIPSINQKRVLENGWDLDIIDMSIFFCIKGFIDKGGATKITDKYGDWYFVSEYKIIKDLPCVPIDSKSAVYSRIKKLVDCNLVERNPDNRLTGKKYLRVTEYGQRKLDDSNPNKD